MVYSQTEGKTRIAPVWLGLEAEKNFGLVVSAVVENTEASSPESATSVLQVQTIYMSIGLTTSELYIIIWNGENCWKFNIIMMPILFDWHWVSINCQKD